MEEPFIAAEPGGSTARADVRFRGSAWKMVLFILPPLGLLLWVSCHKEFIERRVAEFFAWCFELRGCVPFVLVSILSSLFIVSGIPSLPLWVGAGIFFDIEYGQCKGAAVATLACSIGLWCGSLVSFQLGRTVLKPFVAEKLEGLELMSILNGVIHEEGCKFVFVARLSPLLPLELFNYACALTELTLAQNAIGILGSVPIAAFWIWTSASANEMAAGAVDAHKPREIVFVVGLNVAIMTVMCVMMYFAHRRYKEKLQAKQFQREARRTGRRLIGARGLTKLIRRKRKQATSLGRSGGSSRSLRFFCRTRSLKTQLQASTKIVPPV